jgi:hypothetical protein
VSIHGGHLQLRTVARCSGGPITGKEEGDVKKVHHSLGQLFKEEGSKGLTEQRRIKRRGGGGTIHDWRGKAKLRPACCDSGDMVGRGSTGDLARFH